MTQKVINRPFIFFLLLLLGASVVHAQASETEEQELISTSEFIDIVGQQRMLSHQMLVTYAQIGQIQSFGNPVNIRLMAIRDFEKNLAIIKNDERFSLIAQKIEHSWQDYKAILLLPPDKNRVDQLIRYNEQIVSHANTIIKTLVKENNNNINIVNISGQQRMLSQRIALFMLIDNWGLGDKYHVKMQQSLALFAINMNALKRNSDNTPKIHRKLQSMKRDYRKLIKIIAENRKTKERDYSFAISRYTSQLLRKAKNCTKMYVDLKKTPITNQSSQNQQISSNHSVIMRLG